MTDLGGVTLLTAEDCCQPAPCLEAKLVLLGGRKKHSYRTATALHPAPAEWHKCSICCIRIISRGKLVLLEGRPDATDFRPRNTVAVKRHNNTSDPLHTWPSGQQMHCTQHQPSGTDILWSAAQGISRPAPCMLLASHTMLPPATHSNAEDRSTQDQPSGTVALWPAAHGLIHTLPLMALYCKLSCKVKRILADASLPYHQNGTSTLTHICVCYFCAGSGSTTRMLPAPQTKLTARHNNDTDVSHTASLPATSHIGCHLPHWLKAEMKLRGEGAKKTITCCPPAARTNRRTHPHLNLQHRTWVKTTRLNIDAERPGSTPAQPHAALPGLHTKELPNHCCYCCYSTHVESYTDNTWNAKQTLPFLGCIFLVETDTAKIPAMLFLFLSVLHKSPSKENSYHSRLFCNTVYVDEQVPLGQSCKGMSLTIHCNTAACCCK